ncbi:expressed unknown protein [Seminavis robusta]|uniref:Uncharacterized protein n=1 Tax=Seminavis robusta TaxID=568900 RepID=A0A9N8HA56_9STRA|nr:expressed unknown protein [Seminavis robusta]|eukprot:Sro137_g064320.1 n/a (312) ;mRNA; f:30218-31245
MKFLAISLFLVASFTEQSSAYCNDRPVPANWGGALLHCNSGCLACSASVDNNDGTKDVWINGYDCLQKSLSWMCCTDASCTSGSVVNANDTNMKENTHVLHIQNIPVDQMSLKIQVHDKAVYGNDSVRIDKCSGTQNPGGICTNVCSQVVSLADCPGPFNPSQSSHLENELDSDISIMEPSMDSEFDNSNNAPSDAQLGEGVVEVASNGECQLLHDIVEETLNNDTVFNKDAVSIANLGGYPTIKHTQVGENENFTVSSIEKMVQRQDSEECRLPEANASQKHCNTFEESLVVEAAELAYAEFKEDTTAFS